MGFDYSSLATTRFEMPPRWRVVSIKDVAKINESTIQRDYPCTNIEYIDIASVEKGMLKSVQELPLLDAPSRAKRIVRDNDTLISTVRPNLEHYTYVKKAKLNTVASTGFAVVTANDVHPRFLYYYLTTKSFTAYLSQIADSHTSAYPAFNPEVIENAELLLPPASEQGAIAHILGTLDDKMEMNQQMNQTLETMARALFKSWFIDFEPVHCKAEGRETGLPHEVAGLFPDSLDDSEVGEIPKGWRVVKIEDIAERVAMGPFGSSILVSTFVPDGIPVISGQHLNHTLLEDNDYNFVTLDHAEKLRNSNVFRGDIIFTHAGNIGQVAYIPETSRYERYIISQRQFYMRSDLTKTSPFFMVYFFKTPQGQQKLLANTSSTGVPSISQPVSYLKTIRLSVPPKPLIDAFDKIVRPIHLQIGTNSIQSKTIADIRDTLLPKLLSGEIRIKDAEKYVKEQNE